MHYLEMNQRQRLDHFISRMNHADVGSPEYNLCEKIVRYLCVETRKEEKLQALDTPPEPTIQEKLSPVFRYAKDSLSY